MSPIPSNSLLFLGLIFICQTRQYVVEGNKQHSLSFQRHQQFSFVPRKTTFSETSIDNGLLVRGGGNEISSIGHHPILKNAGAFASSATNTAMELGSSMWILSKHLVQTHVVPITQDPHGKLIIPAKKVLQATREGSVKALSSNTNTNTNLQEDFIISNDDMARQQPSPLHSDSSSQSTSSRRSEIVITKRNKKTKRSEKTTKVLNNNKASSTPSSIGALLLPLRLVKIGLAAWIIAEVLDRCGILNEQTPAILKSQFHRVWYDIQPQVRNWNQRLRAMWKTITEERLPNLAPKYQFAIGTTLGLFVSPVFATAAMIVLKPAAVLYGVSELSAHLKSNGRSISSLCGIETINESNNLIVKVEDFLANIRQNVRKVLPQPESQFSGPMLDFAGGADLDYKMGLSTYSIKELPKRNLLQKLKDLRIQVSSESKGSTVDLNGRDLTAAPSDNGSLWKEMIRHGILVGGSIGMLVGV